MGTRADPNFFGFGKCRTSRTNPNKFGFGSSFGIFFSFGVRSELADSVVRKIPNPEKIKRYQRGALSGTSQNRQKCGASICSCCAIVCVVQRANETSPPSLPLALRTARAAHRLQCERTNHNRANCFGGDFLISASCYP